MMMMGLGSNGCGGSSPSSSSNLSALAPPFTVDRSIPKSSSKPLVDLTEKTYGLTHNHSLHNWLGPQPPNYRPDYFSCKSTEFESVPSSNAYRYTSSIEHATPLNPLVSSSINTDINGQNSNTLLEAKPYYPSYVSNAIGNCWPLDNPHNSGYDLLSTSQVLTPNNSLHEDYTQSLSGREHSVRWSGCWEGLTDWQQARPVQLDGSFYSKENSFDKGLSASEGIVNCEEASQSIDAVFMEKETKSGFRGQRHSESLLGEIPKFVSSVCPASTSSASTLQAPETCRPLESLVNPWNHQMPYGSSYEKYTKKHDATTSDASSVINSSHANFIGPIAHDTSLFSNANATSDGNSEAFPGNSSCVVIKPHSDVSSNLNFASSGDYKLSGGNNSSFFLEPDPSVSSKSGICYDTSQDSFCNEKNEVFSGFLLGKNKGLSRNGTSSMDSLDQVYGKSSIIQDPPASLDISIIVGAKNEEIKSCMENVDHYNPAVDSPCWRGAPVSHFSKFEVSEAFSPQSTNKVEACVGPNLQAYPVSDRSGNDAENVSPEKTSKNLVQQESWSRGSCLSHSLKTPGVDYMLLGEEIDDSAKAESCYTKPICFDGVKIADDSPSKNDADTKLPPNEEHGCEGDEWTCKKNCAASISVTNVGMNVNDDPDGFSSQIALHAIEDVLQSPPSMDDARSKFIEPHARESTQKMHVRTLIDTMQNLSELLVFHLSSDACELKKDDYEALKNVIHNLDLCTYKTVERSERVATPVLGDSSNHQKDPFEKGSQASGIHPSNVQGPVKHQLVQEEDRSSVSGKKDEKLSNSIAAMSAGDMLKDDSMIQALKKALVENFDVDEETDPHILLYKNLWLEAEVALCSASCIARFNRIKNEMENHNSRTTNRNTVFAEKLSKSEVSFDSDAANPLSSGARGCPLPDSSIPLSSFLGACSHEDDVADRFNILRCQIDDSDTKNTSFADMLANATDKLSTRDGSLTQSVEILAFEEKAVVQKPFIPSNADDFEDSVMSRFRVLKFRDDNLTSMDAQEQRQLQSFPDRSEDRVSDAKMQSDLKSTPTEEKIEVREFHQTMEGNGTTKFQMASKAGDQSRPPLGDGSSDWEHLLLEELTGLGS